MSPVAQRPLPPPASKRKRLVHALYLAQPVFQFMVLMAVIFVLGRCSPLAPSTDRTNANKVAADGVASTSTAAQQQAEEEDLQRSLKEISSQEEISVLPQGKYSSYVADSLYADKPASVNRVRGAFQRRGLKGARLFALTLSDDQRARLLRDGNPVRLDLGALFTQAGASTDAKHEFLENLVNVEHLKARLYLIQRDDAAQAEDAPTALPVHLKIRAFFTDEKAFLEVDPVAAHLDDSQQALVKAQVDSAMGVAIVLE